VDAKAEKIALFRYGLIANLVFEPLPPGELTRRAEEIVAVITRFPASQRTSCPWTRCWTGHSATATGASKRWRPNRGRTADNPASSRRSLPISTNVSNGKPA
jgi:hypothetical protein